MIIGNFPFLRLLFELKAWMGEVSKELQQSKKHCIVIFCYGIKFDLQFDEFVMCQWDVEIEMEVTELVSGLLFLLICSLRWYWFSYWGA